MSTASPNSAGPAPIRLEMLSQPMFLAGARDLVSAVAKRLGFAELACSQIALAVDEALCNIIRHGYGRRTDGPIWISLWPLESPAAIRIVIEDEARQVDPATIKSRDLADVRPGGLGVHIINEVMDEVKYEHRAGAGMRLTLVKNRDAAQQAGAA
jgi:anti-sigma regulatory factor (Ser/Thr protein kinase)